MKFFLDLGYYFIFSKTNREDVNKKKKKKKKKTKQGITAVSSSRSCFFDTGEPQLGHLGFS